jgi:hypothetical protein
MAADSDFSPETPEIGPGPETDIDTPMFDSAFGGAAGGAGAGGRTFTPTFDTPAPTQAMETPMFGGEPGKDSPFDDGAFQPAAPFDAGTPMPDFSPDSTMASKKPTAAPAPPAPAKGKAKAAAAPKGGGKGMLTLVAIAIICLAIGVFAGPFLSTKVSYIPNPLRTDVADRDAKIQQLETTIKRQSDTEKAGRPAPTVDEINKLLDQQEKLATSIKDLTAQEGKAKEDLDKTAGQLDQVRADLENKNEEFVKAQEAFEDLQNQTAIVQARQMGLVAEVERLTGLVGTLEEANARSGEVKAALMHSIERLATEVQEGIPLTPEKFARANRIAAVEDLKKRVTDSNWITPDLFNSYTDLYLKELEIGASTAYFFARVPVTNGLGDVQQKWAECLMKGNWAVYYRTIDGKNIGSYENVAQANTSPEYGFREMLPEKVQKEIELEIVASRSPDFEEKVKLIAEKQEISDGGVTPVQRVFNSL